ncbi:uncharacterized protein EAF02_006495 [Botrytis sinoallii]|uniref:uncharacterized protein n=1 Tax=Botrytis sinoallii TaxID=1463999 RepID=UPI001902C1AD|nr:uncharacterized protein EAF02_006495 [Botrytis sinoallii]KAF7881807.1 hypothetical protein EAF02_006495 [Botrytis sinoallii]
MSTYSGKFQYDDLSETDSIRLLILHPGTLGSPIQSDLIHTTLRDCRYDIHGNYTALSYVWGDANDTTYIFVDGFRFAVTVNLAAALHDLRDEKRQLRLWADAICINQTNNLERSQQVGLMKEVYSYAQTTVIYLGALVEQTKSLFELMNQLDPDRIKLLEMVDDAIKDIVSRPWFTRVWVYQELVLSNVVFVQVRRLRVPWDYLCEVLLDRYRDPRERNNPHKDRTILSKTTLDVCHDKDSATESRTSHLNSIVPTMHEIRHNHDTQSYRLLWNMYEARRNYQNCLRYGGRVVSLLDVLISRRGSKASDLRDIIYGHLAVVDLQLKRTYERNNDSVPWPLIRSRSPQNYIPVVDYTKSVEDVLNEAARFTSSFRSIHGLLNILYNADVNASYTRRSNLPSWVPDWTLDTSSLQGLPWFFDETDIRNISEDTQAEESISITINGISRRILQLNSIPVYPHILSFVYDGSSYELQVVEKVARVVVEDELAYESARQKLTESVINMFKLRDDLGMQHQLEYKDVFRLICSLWKSLGAAGIHPITSEDLPWYPEDALIGYLSKFTRDPMNTFDSFRSPSKPYPNFLINIIIIALRVGVVPPATEQGDFTLTELRDEKDENSQNCCMFRSKEDLKNETYSKGTRAEIDTGFKGFFTVYHCTYLGKAWVDRHSPEKLAFKVAKRNAKLDRDVSVIAIH